MLARIHLVVYVKWVLRVIQMGTCGLKLFWVTADWRRWFVEENQACWNFWWSHPLFWRALTSKANLFWSFGHRLKGCVDSESGCRWCSRGMDVSKYYMANLCYFDLEVVDFLSLFVLSRSLWRETSRSLLHKVRSGSCCTSQCFVSKLRATTRWWNLSSRYLTSRNFDELSAM